MNARLLYFNDIKRQISYRMKRRSQASYLIHVIKRIRSSQQEPTSVCEQVREAAVVCSSPDYWRPTGKLVQWILTLGNKTSHGAAGLKGSARAIHDLLLF
jgi:hypothetical protein